MFSDVIPLTVTDGTVLGVVWPARGRRRPAQGVIGRHALLAKRSGTRDELYARGRFAEALALYELSRSGRSFRRRDRGALQGGVVSGRAQSRGRRGPPFEPLVTAQGERWPVVAATRLWLIRLTQKRYDDAQAIFASLAVRFDREQLARNVPESLRRADLGSPGIASDDVHFRRPGRCAASGIDLGGERAALSPGEQYGRRLNLAQANALLGDHRRAHELLRELVLETMDPAIALRETSLLPWLARWYGWLAQRVGESQAAAEEMKRVLDVVLSAYDRQPASIP